MFIEFLQVYLPIVIYILLICILIIGIILGVKTIRTVDKVEKVVDDVGNKVKSLNGVFSIIDFTTDKLVSVTDRVVEGISGLINHIFKKDHKKQIKED